MTKLTFAAILLAAPLAARADIGLRLGADASIAYHDSAGTHVITDNWPLGADVMLSYWLPTQLISLDQGPEHAHRHRLSAGRAGKPAGPAHLRARRDPDQHRDQQRLARDVRPAARRRHHHPARPLQDLHRGRRRLSAGRGNQRAERVFQLEPRPERRARLPVLMEESPLALVLSGGGARGAYEVGVLRYILGQMTPRLGEQARPSIFSGTSVGAINACAIAAHHDAADFGVKLLADRWMQLGLDAVFKLGWGDLTGLARWMVGSARPGGPRSLLDAGPLADLVRNAIPWRNLHQGVTDGRLLGVTVSATDIETGHTVVFVETQAEALLYSRDRAVDWAAVRLTAQHALA
ncbi:MAG: hypothetical protein E6J88_11440 [Deltaproteobacteria bacterium]|nr:MAG: hypothetical protein E6J88_11440 [Deltaproteobacteria bacterium]